MNIKDLREFIIKEHPAHNLNDPHSAETFAQKILEFLKKNPEILEAVV